jgi:hypothetical protein
LEENASLGGNIKKSNLGGILNRTAFAFGEEILPHR